MAASAMKFPTYGANLVIDEATIARYSASLKGLTLEQSKLALSTTNLSAYEKELVLTKAGLITATDKLNISEAANLIQKNASGIVDAKALMLSAGLVTQKQIEENATIQLTAANIEEAMSKGLLSVADAKVIASALGVTGVNFGEAVSFDVLTKAIWKNIAAMAKWLVTNPLGWVILGAGAIFGLIKGIDALTESTEEAGEAATAAKERYNEIESEIDSLNSKIEENNKLIAETNGDAQYDGYRKRLEAENKELERQIELERIKAQEAKTESDGKATKALTSETYKYDVKHTVNATGAGYTTTSQKGDIATATDWYLDQAEATGVVSDKLKDYIETIKEQRENLDLLNPESKELYDNLGLLIDRYIALYPNVKVTSDEMADSSENANKMTVSLSGLKSASDKIKSLGSAVKEFSEDGYITVETIEEIQAATEMGDEAFQKYKNTLLNAKIGSTEFNRMMSDLTHKILENEFATIRLENATVEEIEAVLRSAGAENAHALALEHSAKAKMSAKMSLETFTNAVEIGGVALGNYIETLVLEGEQAGLTESQIYSLMVSEIRLNGNDLKVEQKVEALKDVMVAAGMARTQVDALFGSINNHSSGGEKRRYFESKGFIVLDEHEGENWEYNGQKLYSWAYLDPETGVVYDEADDANFEIGAKEVQKQIDSMANWTTPKYSSGSSSSQDKPDYEDPTEATIDRINLRHRELEQQEEDIENAREIAELENDYKKQISLTNDKLDIQRQKVNALKTANDELHQMAEDLRNSTPQWNEEEWFDSQGNATEAYNTLYNNSSKEEQEKIKDQFEKISKIKEAWVDNDEKLVELNKELIQTEEDLLEIQKKKITEILDLCSERMNSLKSLQESYYDVINSVAEAQHEINKELEASKTMYEYLDEDTRKLLFNQEDYNKLSDELVDIQAEAEKLQRRYNQDILGATADNLDEITSKYQMQYETLMKTYEIAKAELEVAKKRQQLDNVLNERNVRMFINGQWQWVADTQNVIDAQNELADAEYEAQKAKTQKEQTDSLNAITAAQDKFTTTINQIDSGAIDLRDGVGKITSALSRVETEGVPALKNILNETKNALKSFVSGITGSSSGSSPKNISPSGKEYYIASGIPGIEDGSPVAYIDGDSRRNPISSNKSGINISTVYIKNKQASGSRYTQSGNTLMGEDGSEIYIDSNGHLIPVNQPTIFKDIDAGGIVFNQSQMRDLRNLWDWSNIGFNHHNIPAIAQRTQAISSIDNSIHINGMTISEQGNEDWINGLRRYLATH